jgi:hypothetical protein
MHTVSMRTRQRARWRWIATAMVVILVQGALAIWVRS